MEIDWEILTQVLFGVGILSLTLFAIWASYSYITSPPKINVKDFLVEETGEVFQRGRYVYYAINRDVLFISPSKPTSDGRHPLAQNSAYYVGDL